MKSIFMCFHQNMDGLTKSVVRYQAKQSPSIPPLISGQLSTFHLLSNVRLSLLGINRKALQTGLNFVRFYNLKLAPMGIEGLLKFLTPVTTREHISSFQGKTAVVDIMSWLYKGCYRCAFELNQNIDTNNFLYYVFEMLDLLLYYKIRPICIFDGKYVGKKEETLDKRKRSKEENKQRGLDYLKIGNEEEARKYLSRCIIIDQRIITTTIRALHTKNIEFMVAPYESDSQIAKLVKLGFADFAITEDSDLVAYGVKVVLKMAQDGDCDYIDLSLWSPTDVDSLFLQQFLQLDHVGRLEAAILSGTDYNGSVNGIGIKRATKLVHRLKGMNNVITHLREVKPYCDRVPENYEKQVLDSKIIFLLATTYNPNTHQIGYLNSEYLEQFLPLMSEEEIQEVVGPRYDYTDEHRTGRLNWKTLEKRQIYKIDFKTIFTVNSSNMIFKEQANQERRALEAAAREQRKEELRLMAESGTPCTATTTPHRKKKEKPPPVVLTEEERKKQSEQKKAERTKRFQDFKMLLNNFMEESDSNNSEGEESSSEILKEQIIEKQAAVVKESNKKTVSDLQGETFSDSEVEDDSCLQFLNPWLKGGQ